MTLTWPSTLVRAIARRRAVVLIGSGVSANSKNNVGERPPTWGEFLHKAYTELDRSPRHVGDALKKFNYLEACDYLKSAYADRWNIRLERAFLTPQYLPAPIHKAIFNLDCQIVVSLNFDKIYETYAIQTAGDTVVVKNFYDNGIRSVALGERRFILKPHGTIDAPANLIFTADDYAKARVKHHHFYEMMQALLHTHVFLCVGCGLSDPDMKLMFEDYRYKYGECAHYITMPTPFAQEQKDLLSRTRGLSALLYSPKDEHKELTIKLDELAELASNERNAIAATQDW